MISRNASREPAYDEKFVVASISNFFKACDKIKNTNTASIKEKQSAKKAQLKASANLIEQLKSPLCPSSNFVSEGLNYSSPSNQSKANLNPSWLIEGNNYFIPSASNPNSLISSSTELEGSSKIKAYTSNDSQNMLNKSKPMKFENEKLAITSLQNSATFSVENNNVLNQSINFNTLDLVKNSDSNFNFNMNLFSGP